MDDRSWRLRALHDLTCGNKMLAVKQFLAELKVFQANMQYGLGLEMGTSESTQTERLHSNLRTFLQLLCLKLPLSMQSAEGSDEYGGSKPFSEPETRIVNNVLASQPQAFVNLHSGEWAMYMPWDSKPEAAENLPVCRPHALPETKGLTQRLWDP